MPSQLARLYIMGGRLEDVEFQTVVLDAMRQNPAPCLTTLRILYQNSAIDSPARSSIVDNTVQNITPAILNTWVLDTTTDGELVLGLLTALLAQLLPHSSQQSKRTISPPHHIGAANMPRYNAILDAVRIALHADAPSATETLFSQVKSMDPLHDCEIMLELFGALLVWRSGGKARLLGLEWRGSGICQKLREMRACLPSRETEKTKIWEDRPEGWPGMAQLGKLLRGFVFLFV